MNENLRLMEFYFPLLDNFGDQHWWPAETQFEVIVGAVLAQFTSWRNAAKAVNNLKEENLMDISELHKATLDQVKDLIHPAGYYNRKAQIIKNVLNYIVDNFDGNLEKMFKLEDNELRKGLLTIKGVGKETADSILLYSGNKNIFVVDAYTRRIFSRTGHIKGTEEYDQIQKLFVSNIPCDVKLYNQYHALIVKLGSDVCLKRNPRCGECPINNLCKKNF
ncbi:endonuclease III domain-containing protein [Clostridium sporogenes]|uniref:endonuclease III domain-containing protein n=1 Tax=Clostridium sporogenes TaxID=1509 RepID=UPI0006C555C4|nr:endonuclease [Clostridium sporogenes]KOY65403.1 endonuclease [Clostridium sporogenes]MDS1006668.1 endonuclease III domain-containing protein [Clostridium sporogenes]